MIRRILIIINLLLILSAISGDGFCADEPPAEARCIWVTRWDYSTPSDIRTIMANIAAHHFNVVFFQIRGAGTVYYKSTREPWAWVNSPRDSLWDPLFVAVEAAHRYGLQVHGWVNVYPGWGGTAPPQQPRQLWNAHRDWFMADRNQLRQPLNDSYVWLSPTHPAVQQHLMALFSEIIDNYAVDGLHFDYFRYPGPGYSYDEASLQHFIKIYNDSPDNLPLQWDAFRRNALTDLLRRIYNHAATHNPQLVLSAAVLRNPIMASELFFQDAHAWLHQQIADYITPMMYTRIETYFRNSLQKHLTNIAPTSVYPGILVSDDHTTLQQIETCRQQGCSGHSLFSYQALFPHHKPGDLARILKTSFYKHKVTVPSFTEKSSSDSMVYLQEISSVPPMPTENGAFGIRCLVDNMPKDMKLLLQWGNGSAPQLMRKIPFCKYNGNTNYFITSYNIPAAPRGSAIHYKISDSARTLPGKIHSVLINGADSHFRQVKELRPLIAGAQQIAIDAFNRVWVCEFNKNQVRIIDMDGNELHFSPIRVGLDSTSGVKSFNKPNGIAISGAGIVHISAAPSKRLICRFDARTGTPLNGIELTFWPGDITVDAAGNIYVLEIDGSRWHLFNSAGREYRHSPFNGSHVSCGIAVNPAGTNVYITCQADDAVHHWRGHINGDSAQFEQATDLPISGVGRGSVDVDFNGNIYVSQMELGIVSVFDAQQQFLYYLKGERPPLKAPRGAALSPDGKHLAIVQWGAESNMRMQLWQWLEHPSASKFSR